jgi:hypothetical protein
VFFFVVFACSRDSYAIDDTEEKYVKNDKQLNKGIRGTGKVGTSSVQIANFTFVFGSNPATGA